MEINLNQSIKQILSILIMMIIPLILILVGIAAEIQNAWLYILSVTWFGTGIIIYTSIEQ